MCTFEWNSGTKKTNVKRRQTLNNGFENSINFLPKQNGTKANEVIPKWLKLRHRLHYAAFNHLLSCRFLNKNRKICEILHWLKIGNDTRVLCADSTNHKSRKRWYSLHPRRSSTSIITIMNKSEGIESTCHRHMFCWIDCTASIPSNFQFKHTHTHTN